MIADYNGWTDQPEEEREALDQLADPAPARVRPRLSHARRKLLVRAAALEILATQFRSAAAFTRGSGKEPTIAESLLRRRRSRA
jgi:hypothetical protein